MAGTGGPLEPVGSHKQMFAQQSADNRSSAEHASIQLFHTALEVTGTAWKEETEEEHASRDGRTEYVRNIPPDLFFFPVFGKRSTDGLSLAAAVRSSTCVCGSKGRQRRVIRVGFDVIGAADSRKAAREAAAEWLQEGRDATDAAGLVRIGFRRKVVLANCWQQCVSGKTPWTLVRDVPWCMDVVAQVQLSSQVYLEV